MARENFGGGCCADAASVLDCEGIHREPCWGQMMWTLLVGQIAQTTDPLSGGAGWVGAGLLGLVLAWLLLKHLPAKDAQFTALIDAHNHRIDAILARVEAKEVVLREEYRKALATVVKHCEDESQRVAGVFLGEIARLIRSQGQPEEKGG